MVLLGLIAGLLLGVLTSQPVLFVAFGLALGCALGFLIRPHKKSCCH